MRRIAALFLTLSLLLTLAGCGGESSRLPAAEASGTTATGTPSQAPGVGAEPAAVWESAGRAYKQTPLEIDADAVLGSFTHAGDYYHAVMRFGETGREIYELVKNGSETLYAPEGFYISCAAAGDAGVRIAGSRRTETGLRSELRLVSYEGAEQLSIATEGLGLGDERFSAMRCEGGTVFLRGEERVAVIDVGEPAAQIPAESADTLLLGGDGCVYLVSAVGGEAVISLARDMSAVMTLPIADARFFDGNREFLLTYTTDDGLYGLDADGSGAPLVIWKDCGVTVSSPRGLAALPGGAFLLTDNRGCSLLTPADPSDMRAAVTLTVASLGATLYGQEYYFNASGGGYFVELLDYSEGGALSKADALTRLITDIVSGNYPDMLLLEDMPVYAYINKGYLSELGAFMDADADFDREDIVIADALAMRGGIYLIGGSFGIDTRVGLYSRFGDACGWTLEEYLEIEGSLPAGAEMLYNNVKPEFFRTLCSRYLAKAIDWDNGTCDFNNADFIALLEATNSIRETPEPTDPLMVDFTPHDVRLREGSLCAAACWIGSVTSLEAYENRVGERLSPVGMPTPDGSCGSELLLNGPIGIFSAGDHQSGCWEFIKYLLMRYDAEEMLAYSSLPVYAPRLDTQLELTQSMEAEDGKPLLSEAGAARFLDVLDTLEHIAIYDETALKIIEDESAAYFAGAKSAASCAEAIEARVSLYVAEQS